LHSQLDLFLILDNVVDEVVVLFLGILAELVHDQTLLEITLIKVIFDENDGLLAMVLGQFKHAIFDSLLEDLEGWEGMLV